MKIERSIKAGDVLPFWCGVKLENLTGKTAVINATVGAENTDFTEAVTVTLDVSDEEITRHGEDDLWRMARLFWLNSDIGLGNRVLSPYTPVEQSGDKVDILGRRITVGVLGLPAQIESYFDNRCLIDREAESVTVLRSPISLKVCRGGKKSEIKEKSAPVWVPNGEIETSIRTENTSDGLDISSSVTYEADGHIDCEIYISVKEDGEYSFDLTLPYRPEAAQLMMGLTREGGVIPAYAEYRWDNRKHGYHLWVGGPRAGLQIKLMEDAESWGRPENPPKMWNNGGLGGLSISSDRYAGKVDVRAWTGKMKMAAGQTEKLHFHLFATPLREIDYEAHWCDHYYHKNSWHSDEPIPNLDHAVENGCKTVILHQGGPLNENINYPFVLASRLGEHIAKAHSMGLKYKIYYTVRELSNYTAELFALRSLGDEIFYTGDNFKIADFFAEGEHACHPRGGPWLIEHLVEGFTGAWHQFLADGEYDCAVATQHRSRWHNYYVAGLDWLCRVIGLDGLYLDGIGYDRHIMRRVRRVIEDARGGMSDIDIHNGNEHLWGYDNANVKYLEHIAYANALWNGEGYDYEHQDPDYYLTEISGIPFGIMGEMLEKGGNPFRGMVYGMTARCGWSQGGVSRPIWDVWEKFGIKDAKMLGYWNPDCPISTENPNVRATAYVKDDGSCMIAVASWYPDNDDFFLYYDREKLGMTGEYELFAPTIEGVQEEEAFDADWKIPIPDRGGWIFMLRKKH